MSREMRQAQAPPPDGRLQSLDPWQDVNPSLNSDTVGAKANKIRNQYGQLQALPTELDKLREHIIKLQAEARHLERVHQSQEPGKIQVLYRINHGKALSVPYLDRPQSSSAAENRKRLHSQSPVKNFELFLERHKEISLIVFRDFKESSRATLDDDSDPDPEIDMPSSQLQHCREVLRPVTPDMTKAIRTILMSQPEYSEVLRSLDEDAEVSSPFLFFFHSRKELKVLEKRMSDGAARQLKLLVKYIYETYGAEYKAADAMFARGRFSTDYLCYVFKPNDRMVH